MIKVKNILDLHAVLLLRTGLLLSQASRTVRCCPALIIIWLARKSYASPKMQYHSLRYSATGCLVTSFSFAWSSSADGGASTVVSAWCTSNLVLQLPPTATELVTPVVLFLPFSKDVFWSFAGLALVEVASFG